MIMCVLIDPNSMSEMGNCTSPVRTAGCPRSVSGITPEIHGDSNDIDTRHHAVILVFEVMAMEQIAASISGPSDDDVDLFAVFDGDGILPPLLLSQGRTAVPAQNLERRQMGMHGVQHRPAEERTIHKPPDLDVAELRIGVDSARIELFVVDHPLNTRWNADGRSAAEYECPRPPRLQPVQRLEVCELFGNPAVVPFCTDDVETHDSAERFVASLVQQDDASADRIDRKVDDDFGAFPHCESNAR